MSTNVVDTLASLYEEDETAWLERMAQLIEQHRYTELDYANLREFLTDMSRRDKREVFSRLTLLITHRLKWEQQPDKRSTSWQATMAVQRRELEQLLESTSLRNYAQEILAKTYEHAIQQAAIETGLPETAFPAEDARSLDDWMSKEETA